MKESDGKLERSTRVLARSACLLLGAVALPIGMEAQIGNDLSTTRG
jgi:hypothetical protein